MNTLKDLTIRYRPVFLYGALLGILVFVLKWLQWTFLIADNDMEIYTGLMAALFTALGVWIASQLRIPELQSAGKSAGGTNDGYRSARDDHRNEYSVDKAALGKLRLTNREYEVLQLISQGRSNAEIAKSLFLSVSTVKTHASNLFLKMEVKSRTQAIEKARKDRIIV